MTVRLPPEIEEEDRRLVRAFLDQFTDDDEIPDDAMRAYINAHASKEYLDFMEELDRNCERYGDR